MQSGYAGEVCHGSRQGRGTDTIHIPEQAQVERDLIEDGAEDSGSLEDESRQISAPGGTDLYEAVIMSYIWQMIRALIEDVMPWIYAVLIVTVTVLIMSTAIGIQP